jgi:hypothetical protein
VTGALALALVASLAAGGDLSKKRPPAAIGGTWDVEAVKVDREDALHWQYKPGDPQLMGRTLIIEVTNVQLAIPKSSSFTCAVRAHICALRAQR